nr:pumilio homolog 12-like [Ipomoea batatas]
MNNKDEIHQGALNLEDIRGKIVSLAKDQNGCRILQDNLVFFDNQGTEIVLSEVIEYVGDLMKNQSGSYLIQKLFSVCSEEQRTNIILAVTKKPFQLVAICLNPFGARAMQKLLEDLSSPQQRSLVIAALCPGAVTLASDPNGHLVILYCLKNFSFEYNKHLINEIAKNCFGIATNRNGCCVLQSCIENACGEARESLVNEIIANAVQLSENPYGNYVVQHLLGQNIPGVEDNLLGRLEGKFDSLARNKYASNVVEKFFVKSGEQSTKIIKELISSPNLSMLLVDPFGNYVIQKALKVAKGEVFNALIDLIMVNAPSMQSNIYGKMILACLSRGGRDIHAGSNILYSK